MTERIAGSTGHSEYFRLVTGSGTPLLGANIASMTLAYTRNRAAPVSSIMAALSSEGAAHSAYRAFEIYSGFALASNFAPGLYRADAPDAAYAVGVDRMTLALTHPLADPALHYFHLSSDVAATLSSLDTRVGSVAAQVGSNAISLGSLHTRVSSLVAAAGLGAADIASAVWGASSAGALASNLGSLHTRANSIQLGIDMLGVAVVNSAVVGVGNVLSRIDVLSTGVAANLVSISSLQVAVDSANWSLASLDYRVTSLAAQVGSVGTQVGSAYAAITSLGTQVGSVGIQVGSNYIALSSLSAGGGDTDLTSITAQVASVGVQVGSIQTALGSLGSAISSVGIGVSSANVGISSLHTLVGSAMTQLGSVGVQVGSAYTAVASNAITLGSLHTRVGSAVTAIGSLTGITRDGRMLSDMTAINSDANAAVVARRGHLATIVGNTTGDSTLSVISGTNYDPSLVAGDQWIGRTLIFDRGTLTAALRGQAAGINSIANGLLYVSSLTTAPASGNTFTIT